MYKSLRAQTLHYLARPHERVLREPLDSPAAWRGDEMRLRSDWQVRLTESEVAELNAALRQARACGKPMGKLGQRDFPLPTLAGRLAQWRNEIRHGRGFVLIRGLPVAEWSETDAETVYWCLGHYLGIPGAQNPEGDLLGHVRDQRTGQDVRYYRTNKALAPHCDTADVVGLLCLHKGKSGGLSRIASSVAVYNELLRTHPELVDELFKPIYFDTKGEGGLRGFPIAPCAYADGELRTFWQSDYYRTVQSLPGIRKLTPAQSALLDAYDALAGDERFYLDMDLQPGDIQLISNHTILHARTAFEDWPELERRRHLLRLWISLPERRTLRQRWQIGRVRVGLLQTAVHEMLRQRLPAR